MGCDRPRKTMKIQCRDAHTAEYADFHRSLQSHCEKSAKTSGSGSCGVDSSDRTFGRRQCSDAANSQVVRGNAQGRRLDLSHVTNVNVFLQHMSDFEAMN